MHTLLILLTDSKETAKNWSKVEEKLASAISEMLEFLFGIWVLRLVFYFMSLSFLNVFSACWIVFFKVQWMIEFHARNNHNTQNANKSNQQKKPVFEKKENSLESIILHVSWLIFLLLHGEQFGMPEGKITLECLFMDEEFCALNYQITWPGARKLSMT